METKRVCPSCQKTLPPNVPLGLCPECLIKSGFNTGTEPGNPGKESGFVPPPVEELRKLFPQLEILELIGKGGMGAVYQARQPTLDRFVALKILPPGAADDAGFAERFNREARALARLNHPHIVAVHDFGQAGGQPYLLMEFVDGLNLRQVEQTGRLTPEQALEIVPQICEALQFAHNEGVVHRDIKPENILLDKKGRVKIADFGIAKILGVSSGRASLTGAKDFLGTPHYMAPEQVEKPQTVDHRADIYSLGVVFYELLTGELPLGKFQPPSQKVQMDVRLDEVVLHALAKEPERRYQHASDVKTAIETIRQTPQVASTTDSTAPAPDWRARVAVVGVRDGKRVVNWPGVTLSSSLMAGLFLIGALLPHFLSGHPFPPIYIFPMMVVVIFGVVAFAIYFGLHKQTIERLAPLDACQDATDPHAQVKAPLVESRTVQVARWTARLLGTLWALMFLVIFIAEGSPPLPTQPGAVQVQFIALALMLAGVVAGWWRDGLATLLLLGGWALFHVAEGHVPAWSLFHVAAVVGVLFAVSWAGRRRTLAAGLVAFLVLFALLLNLGGFHSRAERDTLTASTHNPPPGDQVTFGPEAKGLRAAAELISSHGVFALGEPIEVLFHIRNTSSTNIYVAGGSWRQDEAHYITIEDQQGRQIPAQHIYHSVRTPIQRNLLLPGESAVFHSSGLAFLAKDADGKQFTQPVGNYVKVAPGRYTVRYRLHFPDLLTTGFPQSSDWQGDLDTAPVTVEVTAARQSAAAPTFGPVIERVIRAASNDCWALNLASGNLVISTPEQPLDFRVGQADSLRSAKVDLYQPFEANTPDTVKALDMRLAALDAQAWDTPTSEVVAQLEKEAGVQIRRSEVFLNGSAVYAFSTREGAKGVLQILKDTGPAKLRYKLIPPAATVLASPREVVTEWLWRVKAGTREAWDLTTRSNNVGTGPFFTGLWEYDRIRPLHQLGNEEQAMVVSNPFNDDAGQTRIFYAVLRKRDGQWLVDGHNYVSPSEAYSLLKGFSMNPGMTFDVLAAEVVGEWRAVCDSTISMAADGTGKQLRVGPGGPEPGAKPEPFKWEVSGSTLRRYFADRQEKLEIIWMDDNELQFHSPNDSRWVAWWRKPQVDPPPPASAINAASVSPTNAPTLLGSSATPPLSSGVAVERVLDFDVERKTAYLDLDTGEYVDPGTNGYFTGTTPGGVDLMSRSIESNFDARWGINMSIVPVEPVRWEATPEEIRMAVDSARRQGKTRLSGGRSTNTWFFQTSEGGRGVLQFMPPKAGDDPSQIRLRYRLVQASCNQTDIQRSAISITDRDNDVSTVLIRGRIVTENFDVDVQFAFQRPDQASLLLLDHADQTPLHWATTGRLLLYDPIRGVIVNIPTPEGAPSFRLALNDGQLEFEFGHNKGGGAKSDGQDRFVLALADFVRTASGAPQLKPLDARTVLFTGVSPQGNQVRAWVKPGLKFGVRRLELQARSGAGVFLEQIAVNPQIPAQMFVLPAVESLGSHVKEESPSLSREAFFKLTTQWMDALTTRQAIRKPEQRAAVERQIGVPVDWTAVTKTDMSTSAILRDALRAVDAASAGESRSPGSH